MVIRFADGWPGSGRAIRLLSVVDNYTREGSAIEMDSCLSSRRVTRALDWITQQRGAPAALRCNGPEFIVRHFLAWCEERRIRLIQIQAGRPIQNGRVERFNGRPRDERLSTNRFQNLLDAQEKVERSGSEYNQQRLRSSFWISNADRIPGVASPFVLPNDRAVGAQPVNAKMHSLRSALTVFRVGGSVLRVK